MASTRANGKYYDRKFSRLDHNAVYVVTSSGGRHFFKAEKLSRNTRNSTFGGYLYLLFYPKFPKKTRFASLVDKLTRSTPLCHYFGASGHSQKTSETLNSPFSACSLNPCGGGGTCEEHDNTFTCFCTDDRTGERCERRLSENDLKVPGFSGNGFVELLPMENVDHKVSIEIDFKAHNLEGILLYAQQGKVITQGSDYIALVIIDG